MEKTITEEARERLKEIHRLSKYYNDLVGKGHKERLLELIKKHAREIETLMADNDAHYLVETGDLMILCFEMLLENGVSIDETMHLCFERYERKLTQLIEELKNNE